MRTGIDYKGREWEEIMLGRAQDLAGQTYNYLTCLFRVSPPKNRHEKNIGTWWLCKCKCGNEVMAKASDITNNRSKSCGCYQKETLHTLNFKDLTGTKFGKLTVLGYEYNENNILRWICQCECGNITRVSTGNLTSGMTKSCGCLRGFQSHVDAEQYNLVGQKFGFLTVLEKVPCPDTTHKAYYKCKCDCGNETIAQAGALRSGLRGSCGMCGNRMSQGELEIKQVLDKYNITYLYDSRYFKDLIMSGGGIGRYDFILLNDNNQPYRIIEFDGRQHTDETSLYYTNSNNYRYQDVKANDKIKNQYALEHNIPLVRIPYTELRHITYEKIMGEEFLIRSE